MAVYRIKKRTFEIRFFCIHSRIFAITKTSIIKRSTASRIRKSLRYRFQYACISFPYAISFCSRSLTAFVITIFLHCRPLLSLSRSYNRICGCTYFWNNQMSFGKGCPHTTPSGKYNRVRYSHMLHRSAKSRPVSCPENEIPDSHTNAVRKHCSLRLR